MGDLSCTVDHEHGAKCYAEGMAVAPMMGATSWAEVDAQHAVMEQTEHVQEVTAQYNAMVNTIAYSDMDPSEKVRLLTDAATGYGERIQGFEYSGKFNPNHGEGGRFSSGDGGGGDGGGGDGGSFVDKSGNVDQHVADVARATGNGGVLKVGSSERRGVILKGINDVDIRMDQRLAELSDSFDADNPTEHATRINNDRTVKKLRSKRKELTDALKDEESFKAYYPNPIARFFGARARNSEGLGPDAYAIVPDPDTPSGWKLRIDDASHISGAIQALSPAGFRGERVQLEAGERSKAIGKIRAAINKLPEADRGNLPDRLAALKAITEPTQPGGVSVGPERFAMWASNNFRDRVGEVFPADAIKAAVDRFNARPEPRGHVNVWHVPDPRDNMDADLSLTDWGEIERAAYVDGFLFVEGRVTDAKAAANIEAWGQEVPLGTSIQYVYPRFGGLDADGVYSSFDFDRVSVAPREYAVNPWGPAQMVSMKGGNMPFTPEIKDALTRIWGAEWVAEQEAGAVQAEADLKARGIEAKTMRFTPTPVDVPWVASAKDTPVAAAEAVATSPAVETPTAEAAPTEDVPAWAKALAEQNAAIIARLDQGDAKTAALAAQVEGLPPAAGILGRSVTTATPVTAAALSEAEKQDAALKAYRDTGIMPAAEDMGEYADWGAAGKAMMMLGGRIGNNGTKPAGA